MPIHLVATPRIAAHRRLAAHGLAAHSLISHSISAPAACALRPLSTPHASRAMVSTVSRALGRKVSDEVAERIVDFAGEVLPPGVSKRDWTRVLTGGEGGFLRVVHPSELRREVEEYTRVLGKGRWRLGPRFICREFPKVPDVLTQLLRREFLGFPDVLTRLAGSGLEVSLTTWAGPWPGVEILEVDRSGGIFRMTRGRVPGQWCRIADVEGLCVQLRVFWEIGEWGDEGPEADDASTPEVSDEGSDEAE